MSFSSQATVTNTPVSSTPDVDVDESSDVASTALSTSFSTATPSTLLRNPPPQSRYQVEGIPVDAQRLTINGRQYILEEDLARRRARTSWVFRHGIALRDIGTGISFWKCSVCPRPTLLKAHSTDHLGRHLEKKHRLGPNGALPSVNPFSRASSSSSGVSSTTTAAALITRVAVDTFRKRLLAWMISKRITFNQVESSQFRDLILYLHPGLAAWMPMSGKY